MKLNISSLLTKLVSRLHIKSFFLFLYKTHYLMLFVVFSGSGGEGEWTLFFTLTVLKIKQEMTIKIRNRWIIDVGYYFHVSKKWLWRWPHRENALLSKKKQKNKWYWLKNKAISSTSKPTTFPPNPKKGVNCSRVSCVRDNNQRPTNPHVLLLYLKDLPWHPRWSKITTEIAQSPDVAVT